MKRLACITGLLLAAVLMPLASDAQKPKTTTTQVPVPKLNTVAHFVPRDKMRAQRQYRKAILPNRAVPSTTLPVDGSNSRQVSCPMYANDRYGDCGLAMAGHTIGILSYAQGKRPEIMYTDQQIISQYLSISGGDNGMDEDMEVGPGGCFTVGVGGNKTATAVASMDVDPNDVPLVQFCLDQFYTLQLAWSVPDAFINSFTSGSSYLQPMRPNPNNGHYTTISDVTKDGHYTLWTWGGWAEVSQSFVASVQPSYFVVFCPVQFDPNTGRDSHGRHITTQAAVWVSMGGNPIPQSVIAQFPPATPTDPKAPYKLYELNKKGFAYQVGIPAGYGDLPTATRDAHALATQDQRPVQIHDKNNVNVQTVKPGDQPPAGPATVTIVVPGFTIPGQTVTMQGPFGRTYSGTTAPVAIPPQTVTGVITPSK